MMYAAGFCRHEACSYCCTPGRAGDQTTVCQTSLSSNTSALSYAFAAILSTRAFSPRATRHQDTRMKQLAAAGLCQHEACTQ
eukprot:2577636-Amphidinium_carterae.1